MKPKKNNYYCSKQHHNPDDLHYTVAKKPNICYHCGGSHKAPCHKLLPSPQSSLRKLTTWMRGKMMMSTACLLLTQPPINPWHSLLL